MNPKDRIGITKVPLDVIPLVGQIQQSLAHLEGALKYGPYNWRQEKVSARVYVAAALRHLQKWLNGREFDVYSGAHELGHVMACMNIILDAQASGCLIDDRPKSAPEGVDICALLDKYSAQVSEMLKRYETKPDIPPAVITDPYRPTEERSKRDYTGIEF